MISNYPFLNLFGTTARPFPGSRTAGENNAVRQKQLVFCLLILYLSMVYRIVGLPGAVFVHWSPKINWIPFRDFGDRMYLFQTSMNVVMVVPLGIFLPMLWPRYRSLSRIIPAGALSSVLIELLQMFSNRVTDVDDLIMNTLGAVIGFFLVRRWIVPLPDRKDSGDDAGVFWKTNILVILSTIFLHPFSAELIYSIPIFF